MEKTSEYILSHIDSVRAKIFRVVDELMQRAKFHDSSKLKEPEFSLWKKMDEEPKYPYGTSKYKEKMQRFGKVFRIHYKENRHHPEHFLNGVLDMTLVDLTEMLCDWLSYKKFYSVREVVDLMDRQCERFRYGEEIRALLTNTAIEYFISLGGISNKELKSDILSFYSDSIYEQAARKRRDSQLVHINLLV